MRYIIVLLLLICSTSFADSKQKAADLLTERGESVTIDPTQPVIDNAIERIRRQKIDEAKKYQPTDAEIEAYLDSQIDSLKKSKEAKPIGSYTTVGVIKDKDK